MEACGTAHFGARELITLGHEVRIIPPAYVKAYVRRNKNDAANAAAICEAVTRPDMRFVPVKTEEQRAALMLHKGRDLLVRQQTMLVNALWGHMAELGLIACRGRGKTRDLIAVIEDADDETRHALLPLVAQLRAAEEAIATLASDSPPGTRATGQAKAGERSGYCNRHRGDGPRCFRRQILTRICDSRNRVAAKNGSAEYRNRAIAMFADCL
jgi:transposase